MRSSAMKFQSCAKLQSGGGKRKPTEIRGKEQIGHEAKKASSVTGGFFWQAWNE